MLATLGYAGGVYYSLVSDNFHDFFTEYVPFGEDAVAYFEEREFRKRFPTREYSAKTWPQMRGEQKVTIRRESGLTPKVAEDENAGADLAQRGRQMSALEDNKKSREQKKEDKKERAQKPKEDKGKVAEKGKDMASQAKDAVVRKTQEVVKPVADSKSPQQPKKEEAKPEPKTAPKSTPAESKPDAGPATTPIDHLSVANATEPVVQDVVKVLNNIITAVNASPDASKYRTALTTAKEEVNNIVSNISTLKDQYSHEAEGKIKNAHSEFEEAAKELVTRVEREMQDQEVKWREEFEAEREKLSESYQQKLVSEMDAAKKVADQRNENALLEREIVLKQKFMDDVKASVESEREGRLAKLDELSSSVSELENLTGQWNSVVEATLQTQHLQVALEAVRAKLKESEFPSPFLNELVALKEVSADSEVVNAAVASIPPIAYQRGIPSTAHLIDRFRRVASEVRKASLLPEDAGVASHAASAVLSRLMFAKKADRGLPEGEDVEATLARTEVLLEEGDVDAAAREMNALRGWAGVLSRDWVQECRRVLETRQAVDVSCPLLFLILSESVSFRNFTNDIELLGHRSGSTPAESACGLNGT